MEKEFELELLSQGNTFEVKDYDNQLAILKEHLEKNCCVDLVINDDADLKVIKETRTSIRKLKDTIASARKGFAEQIIGTLVNQLKTLEDLIDSTDNALKKKKDDYETIEKNKVSKPKIITLTIKGYDMTKIEKVKAYAIKQGLEATVTGGKE